MKYEEHEERPFYDTQWLLYDRLCRFFVVAEDIAGYDFIKFGILGTATRLAVDLGISIDDAHDDIFRRYEGYKAVFELDRIAFLKGIALLRSQYGDELLKKLHVLKQG